MLERVAEALCNTEWRGNKFPEMTGADRDYWLASARAAMMAMREPTNEMIEDAHWPVAEGEFDLGIISDGHKRHWQSMIDASLADR